MCSFAALNNEEGEAKEKAKQYICWIVLMAQWSPAKRNAGQIVPEKSSTKDKQDLPDFSAYRLLFLATQFLSFFSFFSLWPSPQGVCQTPKECSCSVCVMFGGQICVYFSGVWWGSGQPQTKMWFGSQRELYRRIEAKMPSRQAPTFVIPYLHQTVRYPICLDQKKKKIFLELILS